MGEVCVCFSVCQQGRLVLDIERDSPMIRIQVTQQCRARYQGILYQQLAVVAPIVLQQRLPGWHECSCNPLPCREGRDRVELDL